MAALVMLAASAAACGSGSVGAGGRAGGTSTVPPGGRSTTTIPASGLIHVAILSKTGPYGGADTALAATSLAQLRSEARCTAGPTCWSDATTEGGRLLIAATVEACRPVVGATAAVRGGTELFVDVQHQLGSGPDIECTGTVPRLWLFGVPLASLPHQVTMRIEVNGGESTRPSTATTSVALP